LNDTIIGHFVIRCKPIGEGGSNEDHEYFDLLPNTKYKGSGDPYDAANFVCGK
jgi:hypothetical protein